MKLNPKILNFHQGKPFSPSFPTKHMRRENECKKTETMPSYYAAKSAKKKVDGWLKSIISPCHTSNNTNFSAKRTMLAETFQFPFSYSIIWVPQRYLWNFRTGKSIRYWDVPKNISRTFTKSAKQLKAEHNQAKLGHWAPPNPAISLVPLNLQKTSNHLYWNCKWQFGYVRRFVSSARSPEKNMGVTCFALGLRERTEKLWAFQKRRRKDFIFLQLIAGYKKVELWSEETVCICANFFWRDSCLKLNTQRVNCFRSRWKHLKWVSNWQDVSYDDNVTSKLRLLCIQRKIRKTSSFV